MASRAEFLRSEREKLLKVVAAEQQAAGSLRQSVDALQGQVGRGPCRVRGEGAGAAATWTLGHTCVGKGTGGTLGMAVDCTWCGLPSAEGWPLGGMLSRMPC